MTEETITIKSKTLIRWVIGIVIGIISLVALLVVMGFVSMAFLIDA